MTTGMWSRLRHLGLETVSRLTSRFGLVSDKILNVSVSDQWHLGSRLCLGAVGLGLGPVGLVSGHCISSRHFVQAHAMHTVAAFRAILTSMTFAA